MATSRRLKGTWKTQTFVLSKMVGSSWKHSACLAFNQIPGFSRGSTSCAIFLYLQLTGHNTENLECFIWLSPPPTICLPLSLILFCEEQSWYSRFQTTVLTFVPQEYFYWKGYFPFPPHIFLFEVLLFFLLLLFSLGVFCSVLFSFNLHLTYLKFCRFCSYFNGWI